MLRDGAIHRRNALIRSATFVILLTASTALAQTTPDRGFHPAGSYAITDLETINTTNGNLMYHIPLASLTAGRGGNPGAKLTLAYNSKLWDSNPEIHRDPLDPFNLDTNYTLNLLTGSTEGGWHYGVGYSYRVVDRFDQYATDYPQCPQLEALYRWKMFVLFPDGSSHEFVPVGYISQVGDGFYDIRPDGLRSNCQGGSFEVTTGMHYYSTDGTYASMTIDYDGDNFWWNNTFAIYFSDGTAVTQGTSVQNIYDRNDNFIRIRHTTYNSHDATEVIDQLNRHFVIEYVSTVLHKVHSWGVGGEEMVTTIAWKDVWVYRNYVATQDLGQHPTSSDLFTDMLVVDSITLPSQAGSLVYSFGYNASITRPTSGNYTNGWGTINQLTLPTGAAANYQYSADGSNGMFWTDALRNAPTHKDLTYQLEYDGSSTSTTEPWDYTTSAVQGSIMGPEGGLLTEFFNNTEANTWDKGLVYKSVRADGTVVERIWAQNVPPQGRASNPFVKTEFTSITNATGTLVKTAIKDFKYDKNGNATQIDAYDWVDYGIVPRTNGRPTSIPAGAARVRRTINAYSNPTPDSANTTTFDQDIYADPLSARTRSSIDSSEIQNASGQALSRVENFYDDPQQRGNLIEQKSWDSFKGGTSQAISRPLSSSNSNSVLNTYDAFGNPLVTTDARGTQMQLTYDANNLYPIQIKSAYTLAVQRTRTQQVDFNTGLVTLSTDVDNNVSTKTTYDVFGRPTLVQEAFGIAGLEKQTQTTYSDTARRVIVKADLNTTGDATLVSVQHYDQMGRIRLSRTLEDSTTQSATDETTGIKVQTRYRNASPNSYEVMSNPYRASSSSLAGSEATMGWSRTKRDIGGRVIEVQAFEGASLPAPWGNNASTTGAVSTGYDGTYTTVTDQAGKKRRSVVDGLGRLIRVDEPDSAGNLDNLASPPQPLQPTSYVYDGLDDLSKVTQGSQTRFFMYDSLKRLIRARTPEQDTNSSIALTDPVTNNGQWSMKYVYDSNSDLTTKVDARNITTNYNYDALNRVTSRTYVNDPTASAPVFYYYDSQALPSGAPSFLRGSANGRLVAVCYGSPTASTGSYTGYDSLGRAKVSVQQTDGQNYSFSYGYNLAGSMTSETYPSGRMMQTDYDSAGRIAGVRRQGTEMYYASGFQYSAHGAVKAMLLGNGRWERTSFNSRLQPTQIKLDSNTFGSSALQLDYGYGTTNNNGNVLSQTITVPGSGGLSVLLAQQNYTYDALNRLSAAEELVGATSQWKQTYDYDRWGNRAVRSTPTSTYIPNPRQTPISNSPSDLTTLFDQATNRIAASDYGYDNAGNLTSMPNKTQGFAADTMTYDAENRQKTFDGTAGQYFYDGDGRRVKKIDGSGTTVFVYNVGGQLIAEYTSGTPATGDTSYLTTDHLGSTRLVTDSGGNVKARYDYLPFGEEIGSSVGSRSGVPGYGGADTTRQKFTQKERDNESGLDYFLARYYSSAQGRFTSADEPFVGQDRRDPQSWNLFTYARNNPLLYVDPTGNDYVLYQYDKDGKVINTYQVRDIAALPEGYTVYGGDENITYVKGPDGTLYTAKYVEGDPGGVKVQAQYTISALGDAVGAELDRSADASKKLIGGFAVGTAIVGTGAGGAAYLTGTALAGSSITTLGLSEAGVAPGAAAAESLFVSEATRQAFQRQLAQHGRAALEKSLQSFERRLAEHVAKLEVYRKAGGYVSSVEKEIKIFKESIQAIKEILGK